MMPIPDLTHRLHQFLSDYFGRGMEPLIGPAERTQNVHTTAAIGSVVGLLFAVFNYFFADQAVLAAIEALAVGLLVIPAWAMARFRRLVSAAETMVLLAALIISFALLISGGISTTGHLWLYFFPFLAFFLKGQRRGWYFSLAFLTLLIGYFATLHHSLSFAYRYDAVFTQMFVLSVFFYTLIASAFNLLRTRFESMLQARVEERTAAAQTYLGQLQFQATHDTLTGLPNRVRLLEVLGSLSEDCLRRGGGYAVCNIRVERLFEFSNVLGVDGADELIRQVAQHLRDWVGDSDVLARTRRDEFVVVRTLAEAPGPDKDCAALVAPPHFSATVHGYSLHIAFAQGLSLSPLHGREPRQLLQQAEQAMLQAQKNGRPWALYDAEQEAKFIRHHLLFGKLRRAIPAGDLRVYFQPQIDLASGRLVGAEALSRWHDPEEGNIPPDVFIPVAEDSGLIRPLTNWLVAATMTEAARWHAEGLDINVSINLSALTLLDPELLATLRDIARQADLPPEKVMLELTESCFLVSLDGARDVMQTMHDAGFSLSIDDYGTGFSSLSYLKHLPIAELKIDQSFVRHLMEAPNDQAIVESTIALAHNFNLKVVAEGVETPAVAEWLRQRGCDIGQGYGFARPMPPAEFLAFARANLSANRDISQGDA